MTKLLFIDTSASIATVAVSINGTPIANRTHDNAHEQAAVINYMIAEVLETAALTINDLDAICVCAGPGSYTGLRVGLSTVKGIAYAADKPVMLFNRLDMLSWQQHMGTQFIIALKARAAEYFMAAYNERGQPLEVPKHAFAADMGQYAAQGFHFVTDDEQLAPGFSSTLIPSDTAADIPTWIEKATQRYERNQFDDLAYSEPFYLKAAYTTQPRK